MKLITPTTKYKNQYLEMMKDWEATGEDLVPFPIKYDYSNFDELVKKCNRFKIEKDEGFVHHSTFWLQVNKKIVAVSNLRHYLNDSLLNDGGHIGYGVRPGYRKMGYATKILDLTLQKANDLGISRALLTCDKNNIGSSKTILKNGGVLWKEHFYEGRETLNYWIEIA